MLRKRVVPLDLLGEDELEYRGGAVAGCQLVGVDDVLNHLLLLGRAGPQVALCHDLAQVALLADSALLTHEPLPSLVSPVRIRRAIIRWTVFWLKSDDTDVCTAPSWRSTRVQPAVHEQRVVTGLDQVRHVRVPQRVHREFLRQFGAAPDPLEGSSKFRRPDPSGTL